MPDPHPVKEQKYTGKLFFNLFLFFSLCLSSITYSSSLLDVDFTPRMILYGSIIFVFSLLALILIFGSKIKISVPYFRHPVFVVFSLLILAFVLSFFKSINPDDAKYTLLKMLQLFFLFILLLLFLNGQTDPVISISKCAAVSSLAFCFLGLLQVISAYQQAKINKLPFEIGYTIYASHANKNTFTECLLLNIPLLVYGLLFFKNFWRYVVIIAIVFSVAFIVLLKSVTVLLGLMVIVFTGMLLFVRYISENKVVAKRVFQFSLTGIILAFILFSVFDNPVRKKIVTGYRYLTNKEDLNKAEDSVFERLMLWKSTASMISEHPVAGIGLDNWKMFFPKYHSYDSKYLRYDSTKFTRPHCDYLSLWGEMGIMGFISFVLIFISGFIFSIKIIRKGNDSRKKITGLLLFTGILSYFFVALSGFPTERMYNVYLLIIYLSLVIFYSASDEDKMAIGGLKLIFLCTVLIASGIAIISIRLSVNRMKCEIALKNATNRKLKNDYVAMLRYTGRIDEDYFPVDYYSMPIAWHKATAFFLNGDVKNALLYYEKAEQVSPYNVQVINDIGTCYDQSGNKSAAKEEYNRVLDINPYFPDALLNLTALEFNEGRILGSYKMLNTIPEDLKSMRRSQFEQVIFSKLADSVFHSLPVSGRDSLMSGKIHDIFWLRSINSSANVSGRAFSDLLKEKFRK